MKRTRQWHLWIGLVSSFFIFIQAATGLIMSEPWIVGQSQNERGMMPNGQNLPSGTQQNNGANNNSNTQSTNTTQNENNTSSTNSNSSSNGQGTQNQNGNFQPPSGFGSQSGGDRGAEQSGIMGFIKGLHEGKIGSVNLKIYIDILAICLMILTVTGIVLSIRVLKAQAKRNKKLKMASSSE